MHYAVDLVILWLAPCFYHGATEVEVKVSIPNLQSHKLGGGSFPSQAFR